MKAKYALKLLAGITMMLSTFLLLVVATEHKTVTDEIKYAFNGNGDIAQTSIIHQTGRVATPPRNIIEGFFAIDREGDIKNEVEKNGIETVEHYRAIQSDTIRDTDKNPTLKLQVFDKEQKKWVVTEIIRIDKENGTVYFLLKTEESNDIVPNDYYTGTYQLIFN